MADSLMAIQRTLALEGGYVLDPYDPGGETNYGITKNEWRLHGYQGPIESAPLELAVEIYRRRYWDPLRLDECPNQTIANKVYDAGVNCGIRLVAVWLQRGLNALNNQGTRWPDIVVDGLIGNATVSALKVCCSTSPRMVKCLFEVLDAQQACRYLEITERNEKLERFFFGWIANRIG